MYKLELLNIYCKNYGLSVHVLEWSKYVPGGQMYCIYGKNCGYCLSRISHLSLTRMEESEIEKFVVECALKEMSNE